MPIAVAPAASRISAAVAGSVPDSSMRPDSPKVTDAIMGRSGAASRQARTAQRASAMSVKVSSRKASGWQRSGLCKNLKSLNLKMRKKELNLNLSTMI